MNRLDRLVALVRELTDAFGPSGHEDAVRELILSYIREHADCRVDALGNIIAEKKGAARPQKKIMLDAHMDEVGMIVTTAREDGLLCFETVGGIVPEAMLGKRVTFGRIDGVIGSIPVHLLPNDKKDVLPSQDELFIDIGANSREQAISLVSPGDVATFQSDFVAFGDGRIKAKAIDDRAGCAILIDLILRDLPYDAVFTFTTCEEVGLVGAKTAAAQVRPDAALVLEATTACDIAGSDANNRVCTLGGGVVLSFKDNATLYHAGLYRSALKTARERQIACQSKQAIAGGNNAGAIHASGAGVPTAALSLPCRYLHSATCVIHQNDLLSASRLAQALYESLAGGKIAL